MNSSKTIVIYTLLTNTNKTFYGLRKKINSINNLYKKNAIKINNFYKKKIYKLKPQEVLIIKLLIIKKNG